MINAYSQVTFRGWCCEMQVNDLLKCRKCCVGTYNFVRGKDNQKRLALKFFYGPDALFDAQPTVVSDRKMKKGEQ